LLVESAPALCRAPGPRSSIPCFAGALRAITRLLRSAEVAGDRVDLEDGEATAAREQAP
jgi:hypothetical protein